MKISDNENGGYLVPDSVVGPIVQRLFDGYQPIYEKIANYESQLTAEVKRRQAGIDELEALQRAALAHVPLHGPAISSPALIH